MTIREIASSVVLVLHPDPKFEKTAVQITDVRDQSDFEERWLKESNPIQDEFGWDMPFYGKGARKQISMKYKDYVKLVSDHTKGSTKEEASSRPMFSLEEQEDILDIAKDHFEVKAGTELYKKLFRYFTEITNEMPYGTAKARDDDPVNWINNRLYRYTRAQFRKMFSTQETAAKKFSNEQEWKTEAKKKYPKAKIVKGRTSWYPDRIEIVDGSNVLGYFDSKQKIGIIAGWNHPGVGTEYTEPKNTLLPSAPMEVGNYTLGIMWDELTPAVTARIIRDCLQLARVCEVNRMHMHIASTHDNLDKLLKIANVSRTASLEAATYWRVYCVKAVPEIPEHASESEVIWVDSGVYEGQGLSMDPDFPVNVQYPVYPIPETVPLNRTAPNQKPDPYTQSEPW